MIVELTGWAFTTAELEVLAGGPITLGAGLTLNEATRLRDAFASKGLLPTIECMGGGDYGTTDLDTGGRCEHGKNIHD